MPAWGPLPALNQEAMGLGIGAGYTQPMPEVPQEVPALRLDEVPMKQSSRAQQTLVQAYLGLT